MSVADIRAHIERKFEEAELHQLPFPHLIIRDFFPAETYQNILRHNLFKMNEGQRWMDRKEMLLSKNSTPYDHRMQINFHKNDPYEAPPEAKAFWKEITDTFLSDDWFPKTVLKKYPEYFMIRFGEVAESPELFSKLKKELFLQRHETDYHIGPHTDISTRIFTCIFSFAETEGYEEFGTQLMRHRDPFARCWGDSHYGFDDYEVVKTAEYRPNNFLLFFKTRQSFHAVKTITRDVPNQRFGMQFQYYEPHAGVFRDLSKPNVMVPDHGSKLGKVVGKVRALVGADG